MISAALSVYRRLHEANVHFVETAFGCHEIASRTQGALAQEALDALGLYTDASLRQMRAWMDTRSIHGLLAAHTRNSLGLSEKVMTALNETLGIQRQARAELSLCLEDCLGAADLSSRC